MFKNRGLIVAALVIAAAVGYFAMRAGKFPPDGTQGTIAAANRYQSEQVTADEVKLDNPDVQSFLQSDVFHKIQTNAEFRKMVTDPEFVAALRSGDVGLIADSPDAQLAISDGTLAKVAEDTEFSAEISQNEALRNVIANNGDDVSMVIADQAAMLALASPEWNHIAMDAARLDLIAANQEDLAKIKNTPVGLALITKLDAEKLSSEADVERVAKGYSQLVNSPEYARVGKAGGLALLASEDYRKLVISGSMAKLVANPSWRRLMYGGDRAERIVYKGASDRAERIVYKGAGDRAERIVYKGAGDRAERIVYKGAGDRAERIVYKGAGDRAEKIVYNPGNPQRMVAKERNEPQTKLRIDGSSERRLVFNESKVFKLAAQHPELAKLFASKSLQAAFRDPEVASAISRMATLHFATTNDFKLLADNSDFWAAAMGKGLAQTANVRDFGRMVAGNTK